MHASRMNLKIIASVVFTLKLIAGCAPASEAGSAEWVEPAWMTQVRQEIEIHQNEMSSCIADAGLVPAPVIGDSVAIAFLPNVSDEFIEHTHYIVRYCSQQSFIPAIWSAGEPIEDEYLRMLDAHHCIVAQGFELPEPQPLEVWAEAEGDFRWIPHWYATVRFSLSADSFEELVNACPMPGGRASFGFGDYRIWQEGG